MGNKNNLLPGDKIDLGKWRVGTVEFKLNRKKIKFNTFNKLPDTFGLNLECAVDNWLARTDEFTDKSLCDYINSKFEPEVMAYTEAEKANVLIDVLKN